MLSTKGMRLPIDVILVCIRWYAAYPLSYLHLDEMMQERSVFVDHSSINRWAIRFLPLFEKVFRKYKHPARGSWRMDETYIKVKGPKRDKDAAMRFFDKAIQTNGVPAKVTVDKSGAKTGVIDEQCLERNYASPNRCSISIHLNRPNVSWPASN